MKDTNSLTNQHTANVNPDEGSQTCHLGQSVGLCEQHQLTPPIVKLLSRISDISQSGLGGEHIIELLRRLTYLRGYKSISNANCIQALAHLADFLYNVIMSAQLSNTLYSPDASRILDPLIKSLNHGCDQYFIDTAEDLPMTSLIKFTKSESSSIKYPLLKIDLGIVRNTIVQGASCKQVQFVIARFLEKTFCRIIETSLNVQPSKSLSLTKKIVSHIAVLLDYTTISKQTHSRNSMWSANTAVSEAVFAFGRLLLKAIIIVGSKRAGEAMWRPLSAGLADENIRFIICDSMYETSKWVHGKGLGGFDDIYITRYACDFGNLLNVHLEPSALLKDSFWRIAPTLKSTNIEATIPDKEKDEDSYVCRMVGNHGILAKSVGTIPCSGALLKELDSIHRDLLLDPKEEEREEEQSLNGDGCNKTIINNKPIHLFSVDPEIYIRKVAKGDYGAGDEPVNIESEKKKVFRELMRDSNMISRKPVNICCWKGLGYSELRRHIHTECTE